MVGFRDFVGTDFAPVSNKTAVKLLPDLLSKFSRVPFTIVLIPLIITMVNDTLLNFGKRYEDDLRVIFDQWPKLHLGLDALSNQKILNGVYSTRCIEPFFSVFAGI